MNVQHIETDTTDETTIEWYSIDYIPFGLTSDGKILDIDGVPLVNDTNTRPIFEWAERQRSRLKA